MSNGVKIVLVLTLVSMLSGIILAFTNKYTYEAIKLAERQDFLIGLNAVLPPYDNEPDTDTIYIDSGYIYIGKQGDKISGYALESFSNEGYSGEVRIITGFTPEGKISGVYVIKHRETVGLGDKITKKSFLDTFKGLSDTTNIRVKKDGGVIDQFSGATMSPRAVADAVNKAIAIFKFNIDTEGEE